MIIEEKAVPVWDQGGPINAERDCRHYEQGIARKCHGAEEPCGRGEGYVTEVMANRLARGGLTYDLVPYAEPIPYKPYRLQSFEQVTDVRFTAIGALIDCLGFANALASCQV